MDHGIGEKARGYGPNKREFVPIRIAGYFLFVVLFAIVAVAVSGGVYRAVSILPWEVYERGSPPSLSQCQQIRSGMSREQVLVVLHQKVPPPEEVEKSNQMIFAWETGSCIVEVDAETRQARKAWIDQSRRALTFSWLNE